eukprot:gnl/Trimastix_PCT/535.p2 GENE.gnl/Trimastix_PCT/535~~gnl/Trimastix_PCT/535.p2  ORF type:complete len:534 (-),score=216.43 gnl/Trimastix_PCT/535:229-1830(-)
MNRANEVRQQNVTAVVSVANIIKTSLGPVGLDKMLVDDIGDVTITNDGSTILNRLEVEHPAAKVLVELAHLQDEEVGDGTTSVVLLAAELVKSALELIKMKIHPTSIIQGYKRACRHACKYIRENLVVPVSQLGRECLMNVARTTMSSKSVNIDLGFFAPLCVDAITAIGRPREDGSMKYPINAINILKAHGASIRDSFLVSGFCLNCTRAAQGMPMVVNEAKIACLDFGLQRFRLRMGIQVDINDPRELESIREREITILRDRIQMVLGSGANVVLCTGGIDDTALKYFVEANAIGVRRVKKDDMRRIAKATGATIITSLSDMDGGESFDASCLGRAECVSEERVADDQAIFIKGCATKKAHTILLRGPNDYFLDEMERSVHDALCALKRTLESEKVAVGGGAVDVALNIYLGNFAKTLGTRDQLAVTHFAKALLGIPKILSVNAAQDATELVARLRAAHALSQKAEATEEERLLKWSGLDLVNGRVINNLQAGVLEPISTKLKALQFATDAAVTILRVDDHITIVEEQPQE